VTEHSLELGLLVRGGDEEQFISRFERVIS
jgi:hypothetical protein